MQTQLSPAATIVPDSADPFLPPIERPEGLIKKLVYYFVRRQYGKVLTPVKVVSARLPSAFGMFTGKIAQLDKKLQLPRETVFLIREQVARLNVCLFCMDIGRLFSIQASMNQAKFDALEEYGTSRLFTEAERSALDYVTELTRKEGQSKYICAHVQVLLGTRDLRNRLACCQRTFLQHDQYRVEYPFRHAL